MQKKNPPCKSGLSGDFILGRISNQNSPNITENQAILRFLVSRYGVPKCRVRTVAELAGIGGES